MASLQENIQQAVVDFDSIKTAIEAKGVPVGASPTNEYGEKISKILGGDISALTPLIERSFTELTIPYGTTAIGGYVFTSYKSLTDVIIPESVKSIGDWAFNETGLKEIVLPSSITTMGVSVFRYCFSLTKAFFNSDNIKFTGSGSYMFYYCSELREVYNVPNFSGTYPFGFFVTGCPNLENVTVVKNFNTSGLNLSESTKLSAETLVAILENLADRTGLSEYYITFGADNLAKLTAEQIAVATSKNWILA
ncbi:MAG: leucine-rich repeat domain-containing protein [Acutalibacteraceae bacterium]|nr:leucine-rich repeat domain-containing protein [Acutalibacteraceae bacterium]